jgi:hypothetical protein
MLVVNDHPVAALMYVRDEGLPIALHVSRIQVTIRESASSSAAPSGSLSGLLTDTPISLWERSTVQQRRG